MPCDASPESIYVFLLYCSLSHNIAKNTPDVLLSIPGLVESVFCCLWDPVSLDAKQLEVKN